MGSRKVHRQSESPGTLSLTNGNTPFLLTPRGAIREGAPPANRAPAGRQALKGDVFIQQARNDIDGLGRLMDLSKRDPYLDHTLQPSLLSAVSPFH